MRKGVLVKVRGKYSSFAKVRGKYSFAEAQEEWRVIKSEIEENIVDIRLNCIFWTTRLNISHNENKSDEI